MRSEEQVLKHILDFAIAEDKIRAVMLNGSRINANAPKDMWQDYDIVFFVRAINTMDYRANQDWIKEFGELVIKQVNELDIGYIIMMQFKDGVRLDLRFCDIAYIEKVATHDSLSKILLDKDNLAPELPAPNDSAYYVAKPTQQQFTELLNECWWIMPYIAKGLLRKELPYTKYMFDVILMGCIRKLLCWHIGSEYNWQINPGYCEKWFQCFLPEDIYKDFIALFPSSDYEEIRNSLFRAGAFIPKIGRPMAEKFTYPYSEQEENNVTDYLVRLFSS